MCNPTSIIEPCFAIPYYLSFFLVDMPKGKYKGQKFKKLVMINITARIKRMMAIVPEIRLVKYKPIITMAASILITLSTVPMFGFIF